MSAALVLMDVVVGDACRSRCEHLRSRRPGVQLLAEGELQYDCDPAHSLASLDSARRPEPYQSARRHRALSVSRCSPTLVATGTARIGEQHLTRRTRSIRSPLARGVAGADGRRRPRVRAKPWWFTEQDEDLRSALLISAQELSLLGRDEVTGVLFCWVLLRLAEASGLGQPVAMGSAVRRRTPRRSGYPGALLVDAQPELCFVK
jgi:hypothetical protein